MATIEKRKKYWRAQVRRRGWEPQSRSFDTRGEAEAWARQVENEMDRGAFISRRESERTTLREALLRYEREVTPTKRASTAESELRKIKRWLQDPLAARMLANIRGQDVAAWRDERVKEGYGANTVRLWLATLSHVFTIARKEWGMEALANPVQVVRKPSLLGTERDRRLLDGEEPRLMAAAQEYGGEIGAMTTLAIETAICRGELAKAHWEHFDRTGPTLKIPAANSKNRPRYVPLTTRAVSLLESLSPKARGRIFTYAPNGISQAFNEVCKRAGLEDLHFHDLRHEATSRFFEMGLDTMEVASITGHKTLQMLRRYTQLRAEKLAKKLV